jgi:hypothetical protein
VDPQKRYYTGVWDSDVAATGPTTTPVAWLASGAETATGVDVAAAIPAARRAMLVGPRTDGSAAAAATTAELQDIRAPGVPGAVGTTQPVIGRYAWWVGDQGVKAPVAVAASTDAIDYAPFVDGADTDLRRRIAQQIGIGVGAATTSGEPAFEVNDAANVLLMAGGKVFATGQLAFLRTTANTALGLAAVRQNYHAWSPNNFAVLADTRRGGLKQDLSLRPDLLGSAFVRWANYSEYMEKTKAEPVAPVGEEAVPVPTPGAPPAIAPAYGDDPLRRRYVMTPHIFGGNGAHQVGPILTHFLLSFNVRTERTAGGNPSVSERPLEIRARWSVSLWNPYTSALVPEQLQIEVTGLPRRVTVTNVSAAAPGEVGYFSLQQNSPFGSPLKIALPWPETTDPAAVAEDRSSWLPGRVYSWRAKEDLTVAVTPPDAGYDSEFYSRDVSDSGEGVVRPLALPEVRGDQECQLDVVGSETLEITLYAWRGGERVRLGVFRSPAFLAEFPTDAQLANASSHQFAYVFRLAENIDSPATNNAWITGPDLRFSQLPSQSYVVEPAGNNPAVYVDHREVSASHRMLDRRPDFLTYNEDAPFFELPRGPVLSMGALQHFRIRGSRSFMIGNSWGVNERLNGIPLGQLFDRFFFSGLVAGVTPGTNGLGDLVLPNPLLKPLRKADGTKPTIDDIRATAVVAEPETPEEPTTEPPPDEEPTAPTEPTAPAAEPIPGSGRSSKFFVQGGAFNLNSTNASAWAAVLRSVRFPDPRAFTYLDVSAESGTAADTARATVQSGDAQFFRFSQSAQETYKAEAGNAAEETATSQPNTHLFRRGMQTLSAAQVAALAGKIAELVRVKHASSDETLGGPFRSVEEFLSPTTLFAGVDAEGNASAPRSLLEAAIADADPRINFDGNGNALEFSSQYLTQADVMTALAPVLSPRSDTFVIRTHGQVLNPVTQVVEGRAWCEAVVQRLPEYFEAASDAPEVLPADLTSELNKLHGRRFRVVSFRWLTLADI